MSTSMFYLLTVLSGFIVAPQILVIGFVFSSFLSSVYRVFLIVGERAFYRHVRFYQNKGISNIIVFGAGEAGKYLVKNAFPMTKAKE